MEPTSSSTEILKKTIQQLVDDKEKSKSAVLEGQVVPDGADCDEILSEFLSQLQTLEGQDIINQSFATDARNKEIEPIGTEEIIKELKNVKRQNKITHWLLSGLILITAVWQMSEYSMMLKVKDGFSHPLRSFGGMLQGMIKRGSKKIEEDVENQNLIPPPMENAVETPFLPIRIPHWELPGVGSSKEE